MTKSNSSFVTPNAVKWALKEFKKLKSDQSALFFQLALAKFPSVPPRSSGDAPFVAELLRYVGVRKPNGNFQIFNPMGGKWLAENYLGSTVYGRLINGSHKWTLSESPILKRVPETGFPADIRPTESTIQNLSRSERPPHLNAGQRLPRVATAILYFRYTNVGSLGISDPATLWDVFVAEAFSASPFLSKLFERPADDAVFWGDLFQESEPTLNEIMDCYPGGGPKSRVGIYVNDHDEILSRLRNDEDEADYIRRLLRGEG
jgi:hypothetical protein